MCKPNPNSVYSKHYRVPLLTLWFHQLKPGVFLMVGKSRQRKEVEVNIIPLAHGLLSVILVICD